MIIKTIFISKNDLYNFSNNETSDDIGGDDILMW